MTQAVGDMAELKAISIEDQAAAMRAQATLARTIAARAKVSGLVEEAAFYRRAFENLTGYADRLIERAKQVTE